MVKSLAEGLQNEMEEIWEEKESDSELISGNTVCAICDDGGYMILCDGKCMRAFHATAEDGEASNCESLGLTNTQLLALENTVFRCPNCLYEKHQCFACGELGSGDMSSGICTAEELGQKIAAGEQFVCPAHWGSGSDFVCGIAICCVSSMPTGLPVT